jgi:hypothetical protein
MLTDFKIRQAKSTGKNFLLADCVWSIPVRLKPPAAGGHSAKELSAYQRIEDNHAR